MIRSSTLLMLFISSEFHAASEYSGAYPAASSRELRSRNGICNACAIPIRVGRLGTLRPLSMKLICLCEIPVSTEISSWLRPRTARHCLSRSPRSFFWVSLSMEILDSLHGISGRSVNGNRPDTGRRHLRGAPGVGFEGGLQRRLGNVTGVVGDCGRSDRGHHLQQVSLVEARLQESGYVRVIEPA